MRRCLRLVSHSLIISLVLTAFACGDNNDERQSNNIISGNNDDNNDNGATNNTNDGTTGTNSVTNNATNNSTNGEQCAGEICEPGRKCVKDVCVLESLKVACEDVIDLGVLDVEMPHSVTGDTTEYADSLTAGCAFDEGRSGADNAVQFELSADAVVELSLTSDAAVNWLVEVRADDCTDAASAVVCSDPETFQFLGRAGVTYFAIVEPAQGIDKGAFQLDLSFAPTEGCLPIGSTSCDAGTITECRADGERTFACADTCAGDVCLGDSCDSPLVVTASMSFSGDMFAYTSNYDYDSQPTCSTSGEGTRSPGEDVVLSLPGLTAGQVVTIDASMDDTNNAIFVQSACGDAEPCAAANDLGDRLEWTVDADGDYFVVVDRIGLQNKPFSFSIDID